MSDTPRTDAAITAAREDHRKCRLDDLAHYMDMVAVLAAHSRAIERELAAANARIAELTKEPTP